MKLLLQHNDVRNFPSGSKMTKAKHRIKKIDSKDNWLTGQVLRHLVRDLIIVDSCSSPFWNECLWWTLIRCSKKWSNESFFIGPNIKTRKCVMLDRRVQYSGLKMLHVVIGHDRGQTPPLHCHFNQLVVMLLVPLKMCSIANELQCLLNWNQNKKGTTLKLTGISWSLKIYSSIKFIRFWI